jgi:hypothetical protein
MRLSSRRDGVGFIGAAQFSNPSFDSPALVKRRLPPTAIRVSM